MNSKMHDLLIKNDEIFQNIDCDISKVCKKIIRKTKCIHDCVLYIGKGKINENKINFDNILKMHHDWTGYEVDVNEILIDKYILSSKVVCEFIEQLKKELSEKYPLKTYCVILYYSNGISVLRFHTYREKEGLWLSDKLEEYDNPVLYDL
jgi:hypothetical protein